MKTTIKHRYQILEELGAGAMGVVYLVEDMLHEGEKYALKLIREHQILSESAVHQFKEEFMVMTRLRHPNLMRVYDFGWDGESDQYYLTMDYLPGITLYKWVVGNASLTNKELLGLLVDVARALSFIHSRQILHRDIKPSNIMIVDGQVKVLDFGLAFLGQSGSGKVEGTPNYLPPEILKGEVSVHSDIFGLGLTFYTLVARTLFYDKERMSAISGNDSVVGAFAAVLSNPELFWDNQQAAIDRIDSPGWATILQKMTAFDPIDRYQNTVEIIQTINDIFGLHFPIEDEHTREAYVFGAQFIGRQPEFSMLKDWLEKEESPCKLFLVHGEVGIGKSRLFQEFRYRCQLFEIDFLQSNCFPYSIRTFGVILPFVSELLSHASPELIAEFGPELKRLLPHHHRLQAIDRDDFRKASSEHGVLVETAAKFILSHAHEYGDRIILFIDDLQWADEGSLEVLETLLKKCRQPAFGKHNLRFFASIYVEELSLITTLLKHWDENGFLWNLKLQLFSEEAVEQYIESVFGPEALDDSLRSAIPAIREKAGGNPLLLQELIKLMVDTDTITRPSFTWVLTKPIHDLALPTDLQSLIRGRIANRIRDKKELFTLQILALLKRRSTMYEFEALIESTLQMDIQEFIEKLQRLDIVKTEATKYGVYVDFVNSQIRDIIIEDIPNRPPLHKALAQRLEKIYAVTLEHHIKELAYHYSHSLETDPAIHYLNLAIKQSIEAHNHEEAIGYLDQLLALFEKTNASPEQKIEILLKKAHSLEVVGNWLDCAVTLEMALDYARQINAEDRLADIYAQYGLISWRRSDYTRADEYNDLALALYEKLDNKMGIATIFGQMGLVAQRQSEHDVAIYCFEKQLRVSKSINDTRNIALALGRIGISYRSKGDFDLAMAYYEQQLKYNEELGSAYDTATTMGNIGAIHALKGDFEVAMKDFHQLLKISLRLGYKQGICVAYGNIGLVNREMKQYELAKKNLDQAIHIAREIGSKYFLAHWLNYKAEMCFEIMEYYDARDLNDEALAITREIQNSEHLFKCQLLSFSIRFSLAIETDSLLVQDEIVKECETLLAESHKANQQALLHFTLFQFHRQAPNLISKETGIVHFQKAVGLFTELYQHSPLFEYKKKLMFLKKNRDQIG